MKPVDWTKWSAIAEILGAVAAGGAQRSHPYLRGKKALAYVKDSTAEYVVR